jgi:hypothetical protein
MKAQNRGVAAPPAAKLLSAQKLAKRRPTLARLLRRIPVPNSRPPAGQKLSWRFKHLPGCFGVQLFDPGAVA